MIGIGSTSSLPAQHEVNDQDSVDAKPERVTESAAVKKKVEIEPLVKYSEVKSYDEIIREFNARQERANAAPTIEINEERARQQQETTERERVERLRAVQRERLAAVERERVEEERLRTQRNVGKTGPQQSSTVKGSLNIEFSYYTADCKGCTGITTSGENVRNTIYYQGMRIVATDPGVLPLWSIIQFEMDGKIVKAIALDTGGYIKGNKIDMLVGSTSEAYKRGRHMRNVEVLRYGK